jgi:DNA-directed RNA polymerase sigma subunit (sigma70/sigma32)
MSFFCILYTFFCFANSIHFIQKCLTKTQWSLIDRLLVNPNTTTYYKNKIYDILYKYYQQWAFTKAYKFKQLHQYKCKHISIFELNNYASYGLYKSITKYNTLYKYPFDKFAEIYVHSELIKAITDLHPISRIPKHERKKGYGATKNNFKKSKIQLIGENEWIFDKLTKGKQLENLPFDYQLYNDIFIQIWLKINELDTFKKRIMALKYNFFFEKIRSNKEVSELMGCSEEWVRQNIKLTLLHLNITCLYIPNTN